MVTLPREYFIRNRKHRILYNLIPREKRTMISFYHLRSTKQLQQTTLNRYETLIAVISTMKEKQCGGIIFRLYFTAWTQSTARTVRRGEPSGHVVIKTKHRTATPRLFTECIQFKRNERLYSKLQSTTDPENDEKSSLLPITEQNKGRTTNPYYITKRNYRKWKPTRQIHPD